MSIGEFVLNENESSKKPLSIYVHIPFCNSKCDYCSFVSMVAPEEDKKRYVISLLNEIKMQARKYNDYYTVNSIYIGGGTPSCLDYYYIRDILSCIYKNFAVKNTAEITIEINPNSIDATKVREYILSGVNRFSIGLQSISPKVLKNMGRTHTPMDYQKAISLIREFGVKNISTDIMLGYPTQKLNDVKETCAELIRMNIPHISAYMLQVEDGTKLKSQVDSGLVNIPNDETTLEMYNAVYDMLTKAGYKRYEISNFAKPTYESYHNKIYWKRKDYLGIGLAAHSYINGTRFANTENIVEYCHMIEDKNIVPTTMSKTLTPEEKREEAIMLSLRTSEGLDLETYKAEFGENFLSKKKELIADLIKQGYLILTTTGKLICTNKGFLVLNKIVLDLVS